MTHLTPTELAHQLGMTRDEMIRKCFDLGVPIYRGMIDSKLFEDALRAAIKKSD